MRWAHQSFRGMNIIEELRVEWLGKSLEQGLSNLSPLSSHLRNLQGKKKKEENKTKHLNPVPRDSELIEVCVGSHPKHLWKLCRWFYVELQLRTCGQEGRRERGFYSSSGIEAHRTMEQVGWANRERWSKEIYIKKFFENEWTLWYF